MNVTRAELVQKIKETHGSIFAAVFRKRHTGEIRRINCRTEVRKYVKGTGKSVAPECQLITVYDLQVKGYRSIPEEGLVSATIQGETYEIGQ